LRGVADYQPERLASIEARFSKPVFPGDTIRTEIWPQGERVAFQCRTLSRNDIVLSNGLATLRA
jgi:acyl dehydratase